MTFTVLGNNTSAILLVSWPFVDEHGGVGGAGIQYNPILKEAKHLVSEAFRKRSNKD